MAGEHLQQLLFQADSTIGLADTLHTPQKSENLIRSERIRRSKQFIERNYLAIHLTDVEGAAPIYEERGIANVICKTFGPRGLSVEEVLHLEKRTLGLVAKENIPEIQAAILCLREDDSAIEEFLRPDFNKWLNRGVAFPGMDEAAEILADELISGREIAVFHDLDSDGITCGAQVKLLADAFNCDVFERQWDRQTQEHGLQNDWVDEAIGRGIKVVFVGDMGTSNQVQIKKLIDAGVKVIVADHHQVAPERASKPTVLLNAWMRDDSNDLRVFSAAIITRFLVEATMRKIEGRQNLFASALARNIDRDHLDLLATMGHHFDVEKLSGGGRAFVKRERDLFFKSKWAGMEALKERFPGQEYSALNFQINIASRFNAFQRLLSPHGDASVPSSTDARELLTTKDIARAREIVLRSDLINERRKLFDNQSTREGLRDLTLQLQNSPTYPESFVVSSKKIHAGVAGIAAARLRDKTGKTVVTLAPSRYDTDTEHYKGSGRSGFGQDLYPALEKSDQMLLGWGAHPAAAGLGILRRNIPIFKQTFPKIVKEVSPSHQVEHVFCDFKMTLAEVQRSNDSLKGVREMLEPCGPGNAEPLILIGTQDSPLKIHSAISSDGTHYQLTLAQAGTKFSGWKFHEAGRSGAFTDEVPQPGKRSLVPSPDNFMTASSLYWSEDLKGRQKKVRPWIAINSFQITKTERPQETTHCRTKNFSRKKSRVVLNHGEFLKAKILDPDPGLFSERYDKEIPATGRAFEREYCGGKHILALQNWEPWSDQLALACMTLDAYLSKGKQTSEIFLHDNICRLAEKATGGGKTRAIFLIASHFLAQGKRCAVVTRNTELCEQIRRIVDRDLLISPEDIVVLDGDASPKARESAKSNKALFTIFTYDFLEPNKINLSDFAFFALDEAQNNKGKTAGAKFLNKIAELPETTRPFVAGVGGSLFEDRKSYNGRMQLASVDRPVQVDGAQTEKDTREVFVDIDSESRHHEKLLYDDIMTIAKTVWEHLRSETLREAMADDVKLADFKKLFMDGFSVLKKPKPTQPQEPRAIPPIKKLMQIITFAHELSADGSGGFASNKQELLEDIEGSLEQLRILARISENLVVYGRAVAADYIFRECWQALVPESKIVGKSKKSDETEEAARVKRPYSSWSWQVKALRRESVRHVAYALSFKTPYRSVADAFYGYHEWAISTKKEKTRTTCKGKLVLNTCFPEVSATLGEKVTPTKIAKLFFKHALTYMARQPISNHACEAQLKADIQSLKNFRIPIYAESAVHITFLQDRIPYLLEGYATRRPIVVYMGKKQVNKKDRRYSLDTFAAEPAGILLTNQAFKEGHDIGEVFRMIVWGGFSNYDTKVQLLGRMARKDGERGYGIVLIPTGLDGERKSTALIRSYAVNSTEGAVRRDRLKMPKLVVEGYSREPNLFDFA